MNDDHAVALPALDGRDPLGFLAAVGTAVLSDARLSFDEDDATAVLHGRYADIDQIVGTLHKVILQLSEESLLPNTQTGFPRQKSGSGPDPMRVPRDQYRKLVDAHQHDKTAVKWLTSLTTDLAIDNQGRVVISAFMAPSGQQSIGTFFKTALQLVQGNPDYLHQALTNWRRLNGFSGEYLDHRALSSAADHPSGQSVETGVPGATWLAIMALPILRITGTGDRPAATTWHRAPGLRGTHMIWPLWRQALTPLGIQTLLEHPALAPSTQDRRLTISTPPDQLDELGIFHINAAYRQQIEGRKFAGVLTPQPVSIEPPSPATPIQATII